MSTFDGSAAELTYGEALCEIAKRVSWGTEAQQIEVLRAIQKEKDLLPPEPDVKTLYNDPRDLTLAQQDREIAELKLAKAKAEKDLEALTAPPTA